jgi:hypothetical protein
MAADCASGAIDLLLILLLFNQPAPTIATRRIIGTTNSHPWIPIGYKSGQHQGSSTTIGALHDSSLSN